MYRMIDNIMYMTCAGGDSEVSGANMTQLRKKGSCVAPPGFVRAESDPATALRWIAAMRRDLARIGAA